MRRHTKWVATFAIAITALGGLAGDPADASSDSRSQDGSELRDGDRGRRLDCSSSDRTRNRRELNVIGLTADSRLICFNESRPENAADIGAVRGLSGDARLVGIDVRPANNTLYGVGNAGGVYTINSGNAAATKVAQLSVALAGTSFGVDVNPAADALRIVSETGQNLRFSFAMGTTMVDGGLTYPPATAAATSVTGAAYTNNDADPNTATTLFDIDSMLDQVAIQSPANSGQLVATGKLGVDTSPQVGFDIYSTVRNGSVVELEPYASLTVGGQVRFYEVDLLSGRVVDDEGTFASRNQVIGIAIPTNQL